MLSALAIKNFAIIEDIRIQFKSGLTVLTGETGAGKSIIIEAVNLLLGSRASADLVRTGEDTAELEAFFDIEPDSHAGQVLEDQGMDPVEGLMIRRVISSTGKSRVYINSRQATLDLLKKVTFNLAGISSQHAHQGLLREENHLDILDEFAGTLDLRREVTSLYQAILPMKARIQSMKCSMESAAKEQELILFQKDEIEAAAILPREDEQLEQKQDQLQNATKIFEAVNGAIHEIYDREGSLIERISNLNSGFQRFNLAGDPLASVRERLDGIVFELQDTVEELRAYSSTIDLDPHSLDLVDQRLDLIARLKRKYGGSLEALFEQYESMKSQLSGSLDLEQQILDMEEEVGGLELKIRKKVKALSMRRQKEGAALAKKACMELKALEMGRARFEVAFSCQPLAGNADEKSGCGQDNPGELATHGGYKIFPTGIDKVSFMLSPNPGEPPKSLARIASGGELSRIVLALKAVLSSSNSLETLVFDEVDSGIGGATSEKVGLKLKSLGKGHQVICITHLAQIAKYGSSQFRISKQVANHRTRTTITPLDSLEERVEEIARMIGGQQITPATLAHARELLREAMS